MRKFDFSLQAEKYHKKERVSLGLMIGSKDPIKILQNTLHDVKVCFVSLVLKLTREISPNECLGFASVSHENSKDKTSLVS